MVSQKYSENKKVFDVSLLVLRCGLSVRMKNMLFSWLAEVFCFVLFCFVCLFLNCDRHWILSNVCSTVTKVM